MPELYAHTHTKSISRNFGPILSHFMFSDYSPTPPTPPSLVAEKQRILQTFQIKQSFEQVIHKKPTNSRITRALVCSNAMVAAVVVVVVANARKSSCEQRIGKVRWWWCCCEVIMFASSKRGGLSWHTKPPEANGAEVGRLKLLSALTSWFIQQSSGSHRFLLAQARLRPSLL